MTDDKILNFSLYITKDEIAALKVLAKEDGRSSTSYMRMLLKIAIAERAAQHLGNMDKLPEPKE